MLPTRKPVNMKKSRRRSAQSRRHNKNRRLFLEQLEDRRMLATTTISLSGSVLTIADTDGSDTDDTLTISLDTTPNPDEYVINDPANQLATSVGTGDGTNTVRVPVDSGGGITTITFDTLGGDDSLTVDFDGGNFVAPLTAINYDGGVQNNSPNGDSLTISGGGTFADAEFTFDNLNDGSIDITGNATITYTGLEPITSNVTATNVTLNYSTTAETITVTDAGSGQTTVNSTVGEVTTFNNPSGTLTINAGDTGVNTIDVGGLANNYPASIDINGGSGGDTVNLNGAITFAADRSLTVDALTINAPNTTSDIVTSGTGSVSLTATRNIVLGSESSITTVNGGITLSANQQVTPTVGDFIGLEANNSMIQTTGTGNISLLGLGAETGNNTSGMFGVHLHDGTSVNSTVTGASAGTITIDGTGGAGTSNNYGVYLSGSSTDVTSQDGAISITGQGGSGSGSGNHGVLFISIETVESTGTGAPAATITIDGTRGDGTATTYGVYLTGLSTDVTSADGAISITGDSINVGSAVSSSGVGSIELDGTTDVRVDSAGSLGTDTGAIMLTGQAGPAGNGGAGQAGVEILGSVISTSGPITIDGTSGSVASLNNWGVLLTSATAIVQSGGAIDIDGTGGAGTDFNFGVYVLADARVETTGGGTLTIDGTSNGTGLGNHGVAVQTPGTVRSTSADITVTGTASGTGIDNRGVHVVGTVESFGAASITLDGTASGSGDSDGVVVTGAVNSAGGAIVLDGTGGATGNGVEVASTGTVAATAGATIEILGDGPDATAVTGAGVRIVGAITSATGTVTLTSEDDVNFDATGSLMSTSGTVAITGDNAAGNNASVIAMADGSTVNAGSSPVSLLTDGNILLSSVTTTSNANPSLDIEADNGIISDSTAGEAANLTGGQLVLRALDGIGGPGAADIDTAVSVLAATNDQFNDINIQNSVGGLLTIGTVDGLAGVLNNKTGGGTTTVSNSSPLTVDNEVSARGTITLTAVDSAGAGDDLTVNNSVAAQDILSTTGNVVLRGGDNVLLNTDASIVAELQIQIFGDFGNADGGVGSTIDVLARLEAPTGNLIVVSGEADNDTISLDPSANNDGNIELRGEGGDDSYTVQLGNLNGSLGLNSVAVIDDAAEGTDDLTIDDASGVAETFTVGATQTTTTTGGETVTYTAELEDITVNSLDGDDAISVTPSKDAEIDIFGGTHTVGDTLIVITPPGESANFTNQTPDSGTVEFTGGFLDVDYDEIEAVSVGGNVNVTGTGEDDLLVINATGVNSGTFQLTTDVDGSIGGPFVGPVITFLGLTGFVFDALAGDDQLEINNPAGGILAPMFGIAFAGGADNDLLELFGGSATSSMYDVGPAADEGTLTAVNGGDTQIIGFTGLEPINDLVPAGTLTVNVSAAADIVNVINGPLVLATQTNEINFNGAFELINFANKTTVDINGLGGGDTINVDYSTAAVGLSALNVNGGADGDQINLRSLTVPQGVTGGANTDTINIGNAGNSLAGILATVNVNGDAHDAGTIDLTIKGDTNTLDTGDILNLNDQGDAGSFTYTLDAATLARTGAGTVTYGTIETLNLNTSIGSADVDVTTTAAGVNTNVTTQDAVDDIDVATTGVDSNLIINSAAGADDVNIVATGGDGPDLDALGSFTQINAGDDGDTLTLQSTGAASRVELNGQAGSDNASVWTTAAASATNINGGDASDTTNLGTPANSLGGLLGAICVEGNAHDAGTTDLTIKGDTNTLDTGDVLNLNDQGDAGSFTYALDATTFARTGTGTVEYGTIETLNLNTSIGSADVDVTSTAAGVNTNITTQDAVDDIDVATTGADGNVIINSGAASDDVNIATTGGDGSDLNALGSFTQVNAANGLDVLTLQSSGVASRVELNGQSGADTANVYATGATSVTNINGGNHTDTINIGSPANSLAGILGGICIEGDAHDVGTVDLTIKGVTNTLDSGDILNLNDQGDAGSFTYALDATTFARTGTGTVDYGTIETLNLNTSIGSADVDVTSTAADVNTNITTQDAVDDIDVATTGNNSNTVINAAGGNDDIDIVTTGADSHLVVNGGAGDDSMDVMGQGANARIGLFGDAGEETFILTGAGTLLTGVIDGGADDDTLDFSGYAGPIDITLQSLGAIDGFNGIEDDGVNGAINGCFENIDIIIGTPGGGDTLQMGADLATHWDLQTANAGQLIVTDASQRGKPTMLPLVPGVGQEDLQWSAFENLVGAPTANDRFDLRDGATLSGMIDGRGGNDSIDYRDFSTSINVNLNTGSATNIGGGLVAEAVNNSSIENVFGGNGNDTIRGDVDDNILGDGFGNDDLFGEPGDDFFLLEPNPTGQNSDDNLFDINGSDTVDFSCAHSTIMIDMDLLDTQMDVMAAAGDQFVTLHTNPGVLPLSPFENVIGSPHDEDMFWVDALSVNGDDPTAGPPVARTVNGNTPHGAGDNDTLFFDGHGQVVQQTSLSVSIPGVGTVNHISVGNVVIYNQRPLIIDNGDFGFDFAPDPGSAGTNWVPAAPNYGGDAVRGQTYGDPDKFASWTASLAPGSYRVSASWVADPTLSTDATYVVSDGVHQIAQVSLDQTGVPNDFRYVGFDWETLGVFDTTDGVVEVVLGNSLTGGVFADAVMFEPVSPGPELTVLMDGMELVTDGGLGVNFDTVVNRDLTRLVTLRNDGDIQLEIIELNLVSVDPIVLGAPAPALPIQLDPGESFDFPVTLQAQNHGDFFAQLQFVSNDLDENIQTKPGAGLLPPNFDVDPFTFDIFGHVSNVFILDNGDVNFSTAGGWLGPDSDGFQGDDTWNVADGDGSTATWVFPQLPADFYDVAVTWQTELTASAPSAQFEVFNGLTSVGVFPINQQVAPADFSDAGVSWQNLGQFDFSNGEIRVVLTDVVAGGPLQSVIADAVRIERVVNPDLQLLDVANGNAFVPDDTGSIDFGDTDPFDPILRTFTLSNPAGSSGPITVSEPTLPAGFTLTSFGGNPPTGALSQVLNPGDTVNFVVQLDAGWPGLVDGRMQIPVMEPGAPGAPADLAFNPYDVQLRGTVTGTQIIDDTDSAPAFVLTGTWLGPNGEGFNSTDRWTNSAGTAVWTFEGLDPSVFYRVAGTWRAEQDHTEPVSDFTVGHVGGATLVQKDQRVAGDDFIDRNVSWEEFGFFRPTAGGQLTVTLTDPNPGAPDTNSIIADAIRIDPMAAPTLRVVEGGASVESGDTLDFGTTPQSTDVVRMLTLQNFGQVPMPLGQINAGPGWIVGGAPQLLPPAGPGGPGTAGLTLTLDATNAGNFLSPLMMLHGDPILPPLELQLQGQVIGSAAEIIDNGDAGFAAAAAYTQYGGQGFQADVHAAVGQTADVATWTFDLASLSLPNNSTYRVSATWSAQNNRDTAVPFRVLDLATPELTTVVDQTIAPDDLLTADDGGTFWEDLGNVHIDNNFLVVEISNNVPYAVVADAIRIEQLVLPEMDLFTGLTPIPHLSGSIDLGSTPLGVPAPLPLTISNPGAASLNLQAVILPAGFSVVGPAPTVVLSNGTAALNLQMDAASPGAYAGHVLIPSDDSDETPYKFFVQGVAESPLAVIDNDDLGYTTGGFTRVQGQGYLNDVAYSAANAGNMATWSYVAPAVGRYRVSASWTAQANRATDAPFDLQVNAVSTSTLAVNQEVAPNDFNELGVPWEDLGVVEATLIGDTLSVVLTDTADDFVIADAVRFELISDPEIQILQDASILTDNASTVAFGATGVSLPVAKTFTINNIGGAALSINPAVAVPAGFTLTTAPPVSIAAGGTGTFEVTFDAAAEGNFGGVVSVLSNDSDESPFEINVTASVVPAGALIIDNDDSGFTQTGFSFWSDSNAFDMELRYAAGDNTGDASDWVFTGLTPGVYSVSATWIAHSNRATDAPFTVYNGTSMDPLIQTVDIDQQAAPNDFTANGSFWEELPGVFTITGSTLTVQLTDDANGYVIADAVRIQRLVDPEIQVTQGGVNVPDNTGTADFGELFANQTTPLTFTVTNVGGANLTLTSVPVTTGEYTVTSSFGAGTVLAPAATATFDVTFQPTSLGSLAGTVSFGNDDSDENPYNFALSGTSVDHLIVDDGDAAYTESGFTPWSAGFQSDLDYTAGNNTGDAATWTFTGLAAGQYRVSATWVAHANRGTDAPYVVDGGGAIDIDQQVAPSDFTANGGDWDDLDPSYAFAGGNLVVSLGDDANGYVIADAVRIEYLGPLVASAPAVDSDAAALTWADATNAVNEAIRAISQSDPHAAAQLQNIDVLVHDLGANTLGLAAPSSRAIMLDTDAAGYGWSIHAGGVDLQTVVRHELHHLLGIGHSDEDDHLMSASLTVGLTDPLSNNTRGGESTDAGAARFWRILDSGLARKRTADDDVRSERAELLVDALAPLDLDAATVDEHLLRLVAENEIDIDSIDNFFAELDDDLDGERTAD